jgi:hypothetical protein
MSAKMVVSRDERRVVKSDGWLGHDNEDYVIYILRKFAKRQGRPEKGELIKKE